jgi:hypothetical protein
MALLSRSVVLDIFFVKQNEKGETLQQEYDDQRRKEMHRRRRQIDLVLSKLLASSSSSSEAFVFLAATFGRPPQRSSVVVTEEEKEKEHRFCQSRYPLHPIRKSSARQEQHKTTSNRRFEESIEGYL